METSKEVMESRGAELYRLIMDYNGKPKQLSIHRLVLQTFNPVDIYMEVDHINHDRSDNRFENLRWCSSSQNKRYVKKLNGSSSQYIGVYKKNQKWHCSIRINGKKKYCGSFINEDEAGKKYNDIILENNLQDFAILNIIKTT